MSETSERLIRMRDVVGARGAITIGEMDTLAAAANDVTALDEIAAYMNRPGPWNGADVCEFVAAKLDETGRELLDNADEAEDA